MTLKRNPSIDFWPCPVDTTTCLVCCRNVPSPGRFLRFLKILKAEEQARHLPEIGVAALCLRFQLKDPGLPAARAPAESLPPSLNVPFFSLLSLHEPCLERCKETKSKGQPSVRRCSCGRTGAAQLTTTCRWLSTAAHVRFEPMQHKEDLKVQSLPKHSCHAHPPRCQINGAVRAALGCLCTLPLVQRRKRLVCNRMQASLHGITSSSTLRYRSARSLLFLFEPVRLQAIEVSCTHLGFLRHSHR